ncbi:MAG TPA: hypothetical protein VGG10_14520 [Rhizomicrobium sp.]|jgi:hypothetical protein
MKFATAAAAIAMIGLMSASTAAFADKANTSTCIKMQSQVAEAISANAQSTNIKEAKDQQSAGNYFCQSNLYDKGVSHYQQALTILAQK